MFNAASTDSKYLSPIWPTIILIGVQKGGTSSVAGQIMAHSAVCKSQKGKETHFHDARGGANAYAKVFGRTDPKCSRDIQTGQREQAMTQHPILAGKVHLGGRHFEGSHTHTRAERGQHTSAYAPSSSPCRFTAVLQVHCNESERPLGGRHNRYMGSYLRALQ